MPLSSDPLDRLPPERLLLWPLTPRQRLTLRVVSLGLSPILWLTVFLLLKTATLTVALPFLAFVIAAQLMLRLPGLTAVVRIPLLPGSFGGLVSHNLRQMLTVLDTWVAILLSAIATAYRFLSPHPDPAALPILAILIALAMSTWAQSLFGLDSASAMSRYRLLPLPAWQILLAKDAAFLGILLLLVAALHPLPAITFGLVSLTVGHYSSVTLHLPQRRWRFTAGRLLPVGALQFLASVILSFAEMREGPVVLAIVLPVYFITLFWCRTV